VPGLGDGHEPAARERLGVRAAVVDPGDAVLNTAYVLFHNDSGERIRVSNLLVSMNVWVPNAAAVITGAKIGSFQQSPSSPIVQIRVADRSDVRRTILLPQTTSLCGNNSLAPCPFQIPVDPPLAMDADSFVFIGFVAPGGGADEVQIWGDITLTNTITTANGAGEWTGLYRIDGGATAGETWIPNRVFDPGSSTLMRNGRMKLVVAGSSPSRPLVVFPDAHVWIDKQWGDLDTYARQRLCSADGDTCLARFEGAINDGPAACLDDSISVDTNISVPPPPGALKDVGRCSLQNFSGASPTPYFFSEARPRPYIAYGVTTFFPNYRNKKDGVVPLDCGSNTAPIAPSPCTRAVCVGEYVTLSAAGTVDRDGDELTYSWTEQNSAVSPLSGPHPTFHAPSQETMLTFEMTATDRCQLVGRSSQTVNVWSGNQAPQAFVASRDPVRAGMPVMLDASSSLDPEGDPITFAWTQTSGPLVQLSAATTARPSFAAPAPSDQDRVTLTFRVTVTDHPSRSCGVSRTGTADVSVVVLRANQAPTADAGPAQTVNEFSVVTLDGTRSSDPDGDSVTWQWTQTAGTPVQLLAASTARPSFIAPHQPPKARETLAFQLVVADRFNARSQPAAVSVVVQDIYAPPDCSLALPSVARLWPPDHRMETVRITNVKERDPEIALFVGITQIRQDEPITGQGSGHTSVDAVVNNQGSAQVRAERSGQGDGRVYHLSFIADDACCGSCSVELTVCVPKSSNKACVDGGPRYDSTR